VNELLLTIRLQIVGVEDGGETYLRARREALATNEHQNPSLAANFITGANQLYIAAESYK